MNDISLGIYFPPEGLRVWVRTILSGQPRCIYNMLTNKHLRLQWNSLNWLVFEIIFYDQMHNLARYKLILTSKQDVRYRDAILRLSRALNFDSTVALFSTCGTLHSMLGSLTAASLRNFKTVYIAHWSNANLPHRCRATYHRRTHRPQGKT